MSKKKRKINSGHYHEALDRVYVSMSHFEEFIYEHPVIEKDKELLKISDKIIELYNELYQKCGERN